jgi:hypothetical protein
MKHKPLNAFLALALLGPNLAVLAQELIHKTCSDELEAQSRETLSKGEYLRGPIDYLSLCSKSPEVVTELTKLTLPDATLAKTRDFAVGQIRRRIEHPSRVRSGPSPRTR